MSIDGSEYARHIDSTGLAAAASLRTQLETLQRSLRDLEHSVGATPSGFRLHDDDTAARQFEQATPDIQKAYNGTYHLDTKTRSELIKASMPKNLIYSGRPQEFDLWANSVIQYMSWLSATILCGTPLPEDFKVRAVSQLLPLDLANTWNLLYESQQRHLVPDIRGIMPLTIQTTFKEMLVTFRGRVGYHKPMAERIIEWHELKQHADARSFIRTVQQQALTLNPPRTENEMATVILTGLKPGVVMELRRRDAQLPDPSLNFNAWLRHVEAADDIAYSDQKWYQTEPTRSRKTNSFRQRLNTIAPQDSASEEEDEEPEGPTSDEESLDEQALLNLVRTFRNQKSRRDGKGNKHSKNGSAKSMKSSEQESGNATCFRCGEEGHIARNCLAPAPKERLTGNESRR